MDIVAKLQEQSELMELPMVDLDSLLGRAIWSNSARADQMPPDEGDDSWFFWLMMAGRGAGKTRSGAEDAWWYGYRNPGSRIAVVAPTSGDCRKVCFEGESGLIARVPSALVHNWNRGEMVLTLTNGTMYQGYSAEEPDRLRGPQHHRAWCDELAAWQYLDDTLDNLLMGLRLGEMPRIVATTTPRPIKRLKEIVADPTTRVDSVSTYANIKNLPKIFVDKILKRYEGTRRGLQELHAKILEDNPNALWQRTRLDELRVVGRFADGRILILDRDDPARIVKIITLRRIVVAVDPVSGGLGKDDLEKDEGDECGIVVVGLSDENQAFVLADRTVQGLPHEWGEAAVRAYDDFGADMIVYEANQGGEMVRNTVVTSAKSLRERKERAYDFVPTIAVWASKGKYTRAEPVSTLYEAGWVRHLGTHAKLEDQMCEFTVDFDRKKMGYSPDRMDALVWAVTHLLLSDDAGLNIEDYYRQEHSRHRAAMDARGKPTNPDDLVALQPPEGVSSAIGIAGHMYSVDPDSGLMMVRPSDVDVLIRSGFSKPPEESAA